MLFLDEKVFVLLVFGFFDFYIFFNNFFIASSHP